ncbi:PLP-dependent transferase [Ceraceosorus guamensis]|uniref:PLP-dependent transferase n=1 Tax=Ceraceosorus guamensis TaxID=1522189 RepID=A0A316W8K8_9BASI|nr:PLP-dependent transferase [Ceraceosorus guamensis]PWN46256.1 PLP-dependent transferase [Ceraceosorus guamensis]
MTSAIAAESSGISRGPRTRFTEVSSRIFEEYNRGPDVWSMFNPLVFPTAKNLGQGFMNWQPPSFVLEELKKDVGERTDVHHYSHPKGRPRLRKALSKYLSKSLRVPDVSKGDLFDQGQLPQLRSESDRLLDPETQVLVTAGANGGMYAALNAFLEPGDEVIVFEPFFDQYICEITYCGGKPVYVPLIPPSKPGGGNAGADEWKVDWSALDAALASGKVKAIIFNTPHNPIGKVFELEELQQLARRCVERDLLVVSDEVYDCLTFDGKEHIRIAALEGMWDRTVTVGSAGKSFAATGWRIGWVAGAEHLIKPTLVSHTRIVFTCNSAASEAAAAGLEYAIQSDFFDQQSKEYEARRTKLTNMLDKLGLPYTLPHGAYFIMADMSRLQIPEGFEFPKDVASKAKDFQLAWFVAKIADVVTIPTTAFVSDEHWHLYENFLRFAFCKDGGEIEEAAVRLEKLRPYLKK